MYVRVCEEYICCGSGALGCNTFEGTQSFIPWACLETHDSTGRTVWRLRAKHRG